MRIGYFETAFEEAQPRESVLCARTASWSKRANLHHLSFAEREPIMTRRCLVFIALLGTAVLAVAQDDPSEKPEGLTLIPERTVAFETDEGTYMNLDVSPDGSTIVFDLLGDLYSVPVTGGQATRLTSGMAYDIQPVFSPDGTEIAFVSDQSGSDNIWVMDSDIDTSAGADAKPTQVTREKDHAVSAPEWSPDGDYLVARRDRKLWLYHRRGGDGMELTSSEEASGAMGASFSPDGRWVYFTSRVSAGGTGRAPTDELGRFISWQVKLRPQDGRRGDGDGLTEWRLPSRGLARRSMDGLRRALGRKDWPHASQPRDRQRKLARLFDRPGQR